MEFLEHYHVSENNETREPYYDTPFAERSDKLSVTMPYGDAPGFVYMVQQLLTPGGSIAHYAGLLNLLKTRVARSQMATEFMLKPATQICAYCLARIGAADHFHTSRVDDNELLTTPEYATIRRTCLEIIGFLSASPRFFELGLNFIDLSKSWLAQSSFPEKFVYFTKNLDTYACLRMIKRTSHEEFHTTYRVSEFLDKPTFDYLNANTSNVLGIEKYSNVYPYTPYEALMLVVSFLLDPNFVVANAAMDTLTRMVDFNEHAACKVFFETLTSNAIINAVRCVLSSFTAQAFAHDGTSLPRQLSGLSSLSQSSYACSEGAAQPAIDASTPPNIPTLVGAPDSGEVHPRSTTGSRAQSRNSKNLRQVSADAEAIGSHADTSFNTENLSIVGNEEDYFNDAEDDFVENHPNVLRYWHVSPSTVFHRCRSYFVNYCSIVSALVVHSGCINNACESGLLETLIILANSLVTVESAVHALRTLLTADRAVTATLYERAKLFSFMEVDRTREHGWLYVLLQNAIDSASDICIGDITHIFGVMMGNDVCAAEHYADLPCVLDIVRERKLSPQHAARILTAMSKYAPSQNDINEFLAKLIADSSLDDRGSADSFVTDLRNSIDIQTSDRLKAECQLGMEFEAADLQWIPPK